MGTRPRGREMEPESQETGQETAPEAAGEPTAGAEAPEPQEASEQAATPPEAAAGPTPVRKPRKARKARKTATLAPKAEAQTAPDQVDWQAQIAKLSAKVDELSRAPIAAAERELLPEELREPPPYKAGSAPMTSFRHFESARHKTFLYIGRAPGADATTRLAIRGAPMRIAQFEGFLWRTDDKWELETFRKKEKDALALGRIKEVGDILREQHALAEQRLAALNARLADPNAPITPGVSAAAAALDAEHDGALGIRLGVGQFTPRVPIAGIADNKPQPPAIRERMDMPSGEPEINRRSNRPTAESGHATLRE